MVRAPSYVQSWAFKPRPLAMGALFGCPRSCGLGDLIEIGWKGTRISLVGRYACSPLQGPRTTAHGPLLQRRETRLTDGFPVTRFMLFEQAVAHQKPNAALANLDWRDHGHAP